MCGPTARFTRTETNVAKTPPQHEHAPTKEARGVANASRVRCVSFNRCGTALTAGTLSENDSDGALLGRVQGRESHEATRTSVNDDVLPAMLGHAGGAQSQRKGGFMHKAARSGDQPFFGARGGVRAVCALLPFTGGTKHRHYSCACAPPSRSPGGGNVRHRSSVSRPAHQRSKQGWGRVDPDAWGAARKQRGQRWGLGCWLVLVISGASVRGRQLKRRARSWNASGANGGKPTSTGTHRDQTPLGIRSLARCGRGETPQHDTRRRAHAHKTSRRLERGDWCWSGEGV